ncbi:hypothetical protein C8A06_1042 [Microbacteriaceae bacterium MWH-Ta3]|nr:hypothetical protein C8A06_1042 [Microbacteriaceae bacterium MWH-Ta3]
MIIEPRTVKLTTRTGVDVYRTLPHRDRKMVGAWCFVDLFGPTAQHDAMVVAAHPHTGLQTATWLISGTVEHRDSVGTVQVLFPGDLNLMTSGHGIAHSELAVMDSGDLHAVQLWIALPDEARHQPPHFENYRDLPVVAHAGATVRVFAGSLLGVTAPTLTFSDLVGAEVRLPAEATVTIPVNPSHEHGVLVVSGDVRTTDVIPERGIHIIDAGPDHITITAQTDSIVMVLGGQPFGEKIVMWWNFIGRTHAEVTQAREQWNSGDQRFGSFTDRIGGRIPAPDLPSVTLMPR